MKVYLTQDDYCGLAYDRYMLIMGGHAWCCSSDADSPQGVCQYAGLAKHVAHLLQHPPIGYSQIPDGIRRQALVIFRATKGSCFDPRRNRYE